MHIVVLGFGSIGRRHLANLRSLAPNCKITVVRHRLEDSQLPDGANFLVHSLAEVLLSHPDAVIICGPTTLHYEQSITALVAGAHVFLEKPIACSIADAENIASTAQSMRKAVFVGYNLRFLPSLQTFRRELLAGSIGRALSARAEIGQFLPDWRPGTDYRESNSARVALGGGIELELSHEIDYIAWLFGRAKTVSATLCRKSDLEIDGNDTAEILIEFESGTLASVHLDMTDLATNRKCRIVGTTGTLLWDAILGTVSKFDSENGWMLLHDGDGDRNDMYVAEMRHFLECITESKPPLIDAHSGLQTVRIALAARIASEKGTRITL